MTRCEFCIHVVKIDGELECHRRSPHNTDLRGYAMWPNVQAYDTCSEGERVPGSIHSEPDYLQLSTKP